MTETIEAMTFEEDERRDLAHEEVDVASARHALAIDSHCDPPSTAARSSLAVTGSGGA